MYSCVQDARRGLSSPVFNESEEARTDNNQSPGEPISHGISTTCMYRSPVRLDDSGSSRLYKKTLNYTTQHWASAAVSNGLVKKMFYRLIDLVTVMRWNG